MNPDLPYLDRVTQVGSGKSFPDAVPDDLNERRVAVERRGDTDFQALVDQGDPFGDLGEIAFHMEAERKEVGDDDQSSDALGGQAGGGGVEVGIAEFQEGGDDAGVDGRGERGRHGSDGLIGGFDPGTMGENDDAVGHKS